MVSRGDDPDAMFKAVDCADGGSLIADQWRRIRCGGSAAKITRPQTRMSAARASRLKKS